MIRVPDGDQRNVDKAEFLEWRIAELIRRIEQEVGIMAQIRVWPDADERMLQLETARQQEIIDLFEKLLADRQTELRQLMPETEQS